MGQSHWGELSGEWVPLAAASLRCLCSIALASAFPVQSHYRFVMAPFLRISFNSYELGSLQAEDEASQPFCAVKMKEALSTGRAGRATRGPWSRSEGRLLPKLPSSGCRRTGATQFPTLHSG